MVSIPVKYNLAMQPIELHPKQVELMNEEEAELLKIARRLSQAVIRMGNAQIGEDFYHQRNDALEYARKCQDELQAWMVRHVVKA